MWKCGGEKGNRKTERRLKGIERVRNAGRKGCARRKSWLVWAVGETRNKKKLRKLEHCYGEVRSKVEGFKELRVKSYY